MSSKPGTATSTQLRVCLLGPHGKAEPSVDRVTNGLIDTTPDVRAFIPAMNSPERRARRVSSVTQYLGTWARFPLQTAMERAHRTADLFHITAHEYGHLVSVLPSARTVMTSLDMMPARAREMDLGFQLGKRAYAQFAFSSSFLPKVAHVISCSKASRDDAIRLAGVDPARISVAMLGIDKAFQPQSDAQRAATRERLGIADKFAVMHIGTAAYKDVGSVIRTVAMLRTNGVDAVLVHVGGAWPQELVQVARETGMQAHIIARSGISDAELIDTINAVDSMLFPSLWEGYGLPVLEAMACGTPSVCSNIASHVEIGEGASLMAPPRDIESFARLLAQLNEDAELRANLVTRGLARSSELTWDRTREAYREVYAAVAEGRRVTQEFTI